MNNLRHSLIANTQLNRSWV